MPDAEPAVEPNDLMPGDPMPACPAQTIPICDPVPVVMQFDSEPTVVPGRLGAPPLRLGPETRCLSTWGSARRPARGP
ncbi:unnamed protein product, partial [Staurois parvus]